MTAAMPTNSVYTDIQGLSQLRHRAAADAPAALQEVSRHFEALFIQMMLQSMRQATPGDPLLGDRQGEMYRDLFDKQISENLSAHGGLGLADIIVRQLRQDTQAPPDAAEGNSTVDTVSYATPSDFVEAVWPHAQRAAQQLGVDPEVLVAQAALETGWGRGIIHHPDGRSSHNLFGIKAGGEWKQETVTVPTVEYRDGLAVKARAAFRAYDSLGASFDDYVRFLQANPRYKDALAQAGDAGKFSAALQEAGYATDPRYAEKIGRVMGGETLAEALAGLKQNRPGPIA